jgi:hypothetical protein
MKKRSTRLRALQNQILRVEQRLQKMEKLSRRYSITRLLIFLSAAGLCILAAYFLSALFFWVTAGLGVIVFNIVAYYHRRLERSAKRHRIWRQIKLTQLARMQLDWGGIPAPSEPPPERDHPFELDLNITGVKSLHHLLDLAITIEGSDRLKKWLLAATPQLSEIQQRQTRVQELAPMSRFRDKLLLNFMEATNEPLEGKKFLNWLKQKGLRSHPWLLPLFSVLALLNLALFVLNHFNIIPAYWPFTFFAYAALYLLYAENLASIFDEALFLDEELGKLKAILLYLETYRHGRNKNLVELCSRFRTAAKRPSEQLKRIKAVATAIGLRMNPIMRILLNATTPWDWGCAHLLDRQKARLAELLPAWLDACFELEALNSLANFAYLNPNYAFPEIVADAGNRFQAQNLGHPLIPNEPRVANDFSLQSLGELVIITGSNMSGKSTFLRTLGINLSLAYAGGPVCADQLQISLFRLFTSLNVNDSLSDGFSFFYAEVRRLKALLEALRNTPASPLFFLIDEIFKGTNNRERLIGSRAYIRALVGQYGFGVIATHDLELAALAETFPQIHNFHFREEVVDSRMIFDYKLRSGPCPTTNALKIMALAGLPVKE